MFLGGMLSEDKKYLYHLSIIDYLTYFGAAKRAENIMRTIVNGGGVSCVNPD